MDTSDETVPQWAPSATISLLILLVGVTLTFGHGIFADFVWDDKSLILDNPWMRHNMTPFSAWSNDFWALTNGGGSSGMYRPVVLFTYWLEFTIFGTNPMGFHTMTILLHSLNTALVFQLCQRHTNALPALLASAIFALHPVQVEAAMNIASHTDLLATAGILISLLLWPRAKLRWICAVCLFLSFCSKESAVVGPIILILFYRINLKSVVTWLVPPTLLWLIFRLSAVGVNAPVATHDWEGAYRMIQYFGRILFPKNIGPITDLTPPPQFQIYLWTILFVGIMTWILNRSEKHRRSLMIILISLLPVCELIPLGIRFADLLLYLPMVGVSILIAEITALTRFIKMHSLKSKLVLGIVVLPMMIISSRRSLNWKDDLSLWIHASQHNPTNITVQLNLANAYRNVGERQKGCDLLERLYTATPLPAETIPMSRIAFNLGNCAREVEKWGLAKALYLESINLTQGQFYPARYNLIVTEDAAGNPKEAIEAAQQLCQEVHQRADSWHIYGVMLARNGQYDKAIDAFQQSLALDKNQANTQEYLQKAIELLKQSPSQ
ncbi:MAG: tetratricopeptide repeat protein [Myxococcota bacterium]